MEKVSPEMLVAVVSFMMSIIVLAATISTQIVKRLVRIETILTGADGTNGMHGDVKGIRATLPNLETRLQMLEERVRLHVQETKRD